MPYIEERCIAGHVITIRRYHTLRFNCKGEKRADRIKLTTEAQANINNKNAERKLAALMNTNWTDSTGQLVTYTYKKDLRPPTEEDMQTDIRNMLKKLRKEIKQVKYIYVKEIGPKGAAHIHMIMDTCEAQILKKCWGKGYVDVKPLDSDNDYTDITKYFIKYSNATEKTLGKRSGKRWQSSRNLKKPIIKKRVVNANTFSTKVKKSTKHKYEKEGYYMVAGSEQTGYTEFGFPYYSIKFRKNTKGRYKRGGSKYIRPDDSTWSGS